MKIKLGTGLIVISLAVLFTGCTEDDNGNNPFGGGGSSSHNDVLSVSKSGEDFLVTWTKKSSSYSEVIYTDDLDKKRGNGYPLTANYTGSYTMPCKFVSKDANGASYSCKPSNVSYSKSVYLKNNVQYKWLVGYGFSHEHGNVEAIVEYVGGVLTVE